MTAANQVWFPGIWDLSETLVFNCWGFEGFVPNVEIEDVLITNWNDNLVVDVGGCQDDPDGLLANFQYTCDKLGELSVQQCFQKFAFVDVPFSDDLSVYNEYVYLVCPRACKLCIRGEMMGKLNAATGKFFASRGVEYWSPTCYYQRNISGTYYGWDPQTKLGMSPDGLAWDAVYEIDFLRCTELKTMCYDTTNLVFDLNSTDRLANVTFDPARMKPDRIARFVGNYTVEPKVQLEKCVPLKSFKFDRVTILDDVSWPWFHMIPIGINIPIPLKYNNTGNTWRYHDAQIPTSGAKCTNAVVDIDGWTNYSAPQVSWNATISFKFTPDCQCQDTVFRIQTISCTDGKQNGGEVGVDCGGSCSACTTSTAATTTTTRVPGTKTTRPAPSATTSIETTTDDMSATTTTLTALTTTTTTGFGFVEPPVQGDVKSAELATPFNWYYVLYGVAGLFVLAVIVWGIYYFVCGKQAKRSKELQLRSNSQDDGDGIYSQRFNRPKPAERQRTKMSPEMQPLKTVPTTQELEDASGSGAVMYPSISYEMNSQMPEKSGNAQFSSLSQMAPVETRPTSPVYTAFYTQQTTQQDLSPPRTPSPPPRQWRSPPPNSPPENRLPPPRRPGPSGANY